MVIMGGGVIVCGDCGSRGGDGVWVCVMLCDDGDGVVVMVCGGCDRGGDVGWWWYQRW